MLQRFEGRGNADRQHKGLEIELQLCQHGQGIIEVVDHLLRTVADEAPSLVFLHGGSQQHGSQHFLFFHGIAIWSVTSWEVRAKRDVTPEATWKKAYLSETRF